MNFTLCLSLFIDWFILLIFLPPSFLSIFFNFLSSVLYFVCLLLSSRMLIFVLRPFFLLFIPFYSVLPCYPFPSFFRLISTFISALWRSRFELLSTVSPFLELLSSTVNNISFVAPHSPLLSQRADVQDDILCPTGADGLPQCPGGKSYCTCAHIIKIKLGALVQIILSDHSKSKHVYLYRLSFAKVIVFVWGSRWLQIGRSLVRSQLVSLEFFIDKKSFRSHYSPGVDLASNRNEYREHFLEVKAAGA